MAKEISASLRWQDGLRLLGRAGGHEIVLDSTPPLGSDKGISPKQALLLAVAGCSAMDVAALLKKYKQPPHTFEVKINGPIKETHPAVFTSMDVQYIINGEVAPEKFIEAVTLSMTKYCGVSAMVSKACPINLTVILNDKEIHRGQANF